MMIWKMSRMQQKREAMTWIKYCGLLTIEWKPQAYFENIDDGFKNIKRKRYEWNTVDCWLFKMWWEIWDHESENIQSNFSFMRYYLNDTIVRHEKIMNNKIKKDSLSIWHWFQQWNGYWNNEHNMNIIVKDKFLSYGLHYTYVVEFAVPVLSKEWTCLCYQISQLTINVWCFLQHCRYRCPKIIFQGLCEKYN